MEKTLTPDFFVPDFDGTKSITPDFQFPFNEDNFEYREDNADIFDTAAAAVPQFGIVRGIGNTLGNLFGSHEDKSATGYNQFLSSYAPLSFYPTKDEMIAAAKQGQYETGGKSDGSEQAAISSSYDQSNGTFNHGDWKGIVTSTNPIRWNIFKGAKEKHNFSSSVNAKIPVTQAPSQAQPIAAIPKASQVLAQPKAQLFSAPPASTPPASQPISQPVQQPAQSGTPTTNVGAASLVDQVKNLLPTGRQASGSETAIYIGVGVVIVVVVLVLALKK